MELNPWKVGKLMRFSPPNSGEVTPNVLEFADTPGDNQNPAARNSVGSYNTHDPYSMGYGLVGSQGRYASPSSHYLVPDEQTIPVESRGSAEPRDGFDGRSVFDLPRDAAVRDVGDRSSGSLEEVERAIAEINGSAGAEDKSREDLILEDDARIWDRYEVGPDQQGDANLPEASDQYGIPYEDISLLYHPQADIISGSDGSGNYIGAIDSLDPDLESIIGEFDNVDTDLDDTLLEILQEDEMGAIVDPFDPYLPEVPPENDADLEEDELDPYAEVFDLLEI